MDTILHRIGRAHGTITIRFVCIKRVKCIFEQLNINVEPSVMGCLNTFRHASVVSAVATGVVAGLGTDGYALALDWIVKRLEGAR